MFVRDITIYTCFLTFYSHLYILKYSFFAQFKKNINIYLTVLVKILTSNKMFKIC